MNATSLRPLALAAVLFFSVVNVLSARDEPAEADAASAKWLLTAIEQGDYDMFVTGAEPQFAKITPEQFAAVSEKLAPRFKAGYHLSYLGELRQKGYHVTLWRVRFTDDSDDALATLSTRDGKVGGFWIK